MRKRTAILTWFGSNLGARQEKSRKEKKNGNTRGGDRNTHINQ